MKKPNNNRAISPLWVIGIYLLCLLLMLLGWHVSNGYIETGEKINTNKTLTSVGRLKADQIQWYLADNKNGASVVAKFLENPSGQHWLMHQGIKAPAELNRLAESIVNVHQHGKLLLLDTDANIRLAIGSGGVLSETGKSIALRMMREPIPITYQIYFGDPSEPDIPVLETFVPIMDADGTKSVGMVMLRDKPVFLFNLMQTWPTETETAESTLFTKDGNDVLFLNDLRHRKNTALKLRIPLGDNPDSTGWPAISAITSHLGLIEGRDYRNKQVLAYTLPVPDTSWSMVVKMDAEEATRRSHAIRGFTAIALAIISGLIGIIIWTWWRKAETLHELRLMLEASNEGFWKIDLSGHIVKVNEAYCRFTGYARDEIIGAHVSKFEAVEQTPEAVAEHIRHVVKRGFDRFETRHRHRDGHLIDVDITVSFIPETKYLIAFLHDVTERKRAEKTLIESEIKYRRLHESMRDAFVMVDMSGLLMDFNYAYQEMLGYPTEELQRLTYVDLTPQKWHEFEARIVGEQVIPHGRSEVYEKEYIRKDGTIFPVELKTFLIRGADDQPEAMWAIVRDITERKQIQLALEHQQDLLNEAQRLGHLGSWELNLTSGVLVWSDEVYRIFEIDPARISSLSYEFFLGVIHPDDRDKVNRAYMQSLENHQPYDIEHRLRLADGRIKWLRERCTTEFNALGKPLRSVGVVQDITEQKLAEETLRIAATTFETHEGITITDIDANIIRVNRSFEEITGYKQEEIIGKNPRFLHSGRQDDAFYAEMWRQLLGNGSWSGEIWNKRKNGEIYPEWLTITAVKNGLGETTEYVGIFNDNSLRKEAEDRLRRHNAELEEVNRQLNDTRNLLLQSDKMASVGQLAAGVAHEINNPIGYVGSNLGTLNEYLKELFDLVAVYEEMENVVTDRSLLALVNAVKNKVNLGFLKEDIPALMMETQEGIIRVKKIVQDLKGFSRADSSDEWHLADLHKGLDSTLNVASNEIKYKAEVRKEYGDIPEVECVISQLNQVFMNLLVNAAHAIENHGIITVRTGQQDGEVWVEIADTGKGIAPEHLNRIFDPFFTTKQIGKGTGLGLSLSYGIIQKHHGRIEVSSKVGKGTSFKVWLPVSQPKDDNTTTHA